MKSVVISIKSGIVHEQFGYATVIDLDSHMDSPSEDIASEMVFLAWVSSLEKNPNDYEHPFLAAIRVASLGLS